MVTIDRLAAEQLGIVSRDQLAARLKMSRSAIRWAVTSEALFPFLGATFRLPGVKAGWQHRAMAASLLAGKDGALSHATAASVWGVAGFKTSGPIHVTIPRGISRVFFDGVVQHRSTRSLKTVDRGGLTVTPLARTLFDVAADLDDLELESALDSAQFGNPFLEQALDAELAANDDKGRPGAGRIRRLLELREGTTTESPLETRVRAALRASGLPKPALQYDISSGRQRVIRADFAWPNQKLVLHCDSFGWHSKPRQFELDAVQRSQLEALGWGSSIVTARMLDNKDWLARLRTSLERRSR